jgi:hypothetical protein
MSGSADLRFVRRAYFNALRRLPSAAEEQFHRSRLTGGTSRASLILSFFDGLEFRTGGSFVSGLYRVLLGRVPENSGWAFQLNSVIANNTPQAALTRNFLTSSEWLMKQAGAVSDVAFVNLLYREIFERTPSTAEVAFQLCSYVECAASVPRSALSVDKRAQMATSFLAVPEFFVKRGPLLNALHAYFVILGRDPSKDELAAVEAQLRTGIPFSSIVAAFLVSPEHVAALQ